MPYPFDHANGDLTKVVTSGSGTFNYTYDDYHNVKCATNGLITQNYTYDSSGHVVSSSLSGKNYTKMITSSVTYTAEGALGEVQMDSGLSYRYMYDSLGRLISSSRHDGGVLKLETRQEYDTSNRLSKQYLNLVDTTYSERYNYDSYGRLSSMTAGDGQTITLSYDPLSRLATVTGPVAKVTYGYANGANSGETTGLVSSMAYTAAGGSGLSELTFGYSYDNAGNIIEIQDPISGKTITYTYDAQGQLLSETIDGATTQYYYDSVGNRIDNTDPEHPLYVYGDDVWHDLLTAYDGEDIIYDEIGNPESYYNGTRWTFDWDNGRELATASRDTASVSYEYDFDGIRTSKTVVSHTHSYTSTYVAATCTTGAYSQYTCACGEIRRIFHGNARGHSFSSPIGPMTPCIRCGIKYGDVGSVEVPELEEHVAGNPLAYATTTTHNYIYAGGKLIRETYGTTTLDFLYDQNGKPYAMMYDGEPYYYITNLQGDVVRLVDENGAAVATYQYNAWGEIIDIDGELAEINPLRYRGYYYDAESGFYYLQSRYYDPAIGRFINADSFASTGQGFLGYNMFAYCGNDPVNCADPSGQICNEIMGIFLAISGTYYYMSMMEIAEQNYVHNAAIDADSSTTTHNRLINDQNGSTGANFRYGNYPASYNGCEAIAIHNIKVLKGMDSTLSQTMYDCQAVGAIVAYGGFGSNPYELGNVLDYYGMSYTVIQQEDMNKPGTYIVSYWTAGAFQSPLHTVAVYYDGKQYTTYNLYGDGKTYDLAPSAYIPEGGFIRGYYLG